MSKQAYFLWHAYCPFLCNCKNIVESIRVQPDEEIAKALPELVMPPQVKVVNPQKASISSGGVVTSTKLTRDKKKVALAAEKAIMELRGAIQHFRNHPIEPGIFLELEENYMVEKMTEIETHKEELEAALDIQIEAKKQIENDFSDENASSRVTANQNQEVVVIDTIEPGSVDEQLNNARQEDEEGVPGEGEPEAPGERGGAG